MLSVASVVSVCACSIGALAPFGATERVVFVDDSAPTGGDGSSWSSAYRDLQLALVDARSDPAVTEIRVAAGLYFPDRGTGDRSASFALGGLTDVSLLGGFPDGGGSIEQRDPTTHPTVLSGDLAQNDVVVVNPYVVGQGNVSTSGPYFSNYGENSYTIVTAVGVDRSVVFEGFVVRGGNSPDHGSGMDIIESSLTIHDVTFSENFTGVLSGEGEGGGVYILDCPGVFTLADCRFERNTSLRYGGGLFAQGTSLVLKRCEFVDNAAGNGPSQNGSGGGVYLEPVAGKRLMIRDCEFVRNVARGSSRGGGVYCRTSAVVRDSWFHDNRAGGSGGGCRLKDSALLNCQFTNNVASRGAGAYLDGDCQATRCAFDGNTEGSGNGMYAYRSSVTDCAFTNNVGVGGEGGGGQFSESWVTRCSFSGNWAAYGGGAAFRESNVSDCYFFQNRAQLRGAGAMLEGLSVVDRCVFDHGFSVRDGGGVLIRNNENTLMNSLVVGNSALMLGGGVYAEDDGNQLVNVTIVQNEAMVTGGVSAEDPLLLRNAIVWGNRDEQSTGEDAQLGGEATFDVANSIIMGLSAYAGFSNSGSDPLFADPLGSDSLPGTGDEDFRLLSASPGIDGGNNASVPTGIVLDLERMARIVGFAGGPARVDIGAYETQDCDANGVSDFIDIQNGVADGNNNGVPDVCELGCPGDLTQTGGGPASGPDGVVDLCDLLSFVTAWESGLGSPDGSIADVTTTGSVEGDGGFGQPDGAVDLSDLLYFIGAWLIGRKLCPG